MATILKKEWSIGLWFILAMYICMTFSIGGVSPIQLTFLGSILLFPHLFQVDGKSKMNLHFLSLPIERKTIVYGRYLFLGLYTLSLIILGYLFNQLTILFSLDWASFTAISIYESAFLFAAILFVFSCFLPTFYLFRYNIAALITVLMVFLMFITYTIFTFGVSALNHNVTESLSIIQYAPVALLLSILIYWLSCQLSIWIFERKDLHD